MLFRKKTIQQCVTAGLILLMAVSARAQNLDVTPPATRETVEFDQLIYKGVVGNLLETVSLDPAERVELQRANAVIGNALSGRTLAVLLGVANPLLMIGGLMWGIFAASRIKPPRQAPAARAGVCGDEWLAIAEAAAPDLASKSPPVPAQAEVASIQR